MYLNEQYYKMSPTAGG